MTVLLLIAVTGLLYEIVRGQRERRQYERPGPNGKRNYADLAKEMGHDPHYG